MPHVKRFKKDQKFTKKCKKIIIMRFTTSNGPFKHSKYIFWKLLFIIPELLKILVPKF